jgi:hypothetical protein
MGMGLPMIIACPEGEATGIVRDTGSGVVVPPEQPAVLASCVQELYANRERLGELARASADSASTYDRAGQAVLMLESLEKVVRR